MSSAPPPNKHLNLRRARKRAGATRRVDIDPAAQVARINMLTQTSRTSWLGLLSYLAFVAVALMGVEDADFFIPERQTPLPLIGVSIPTFLFFVLGPFLGLLLYAYFHMHLIKLWEALGETKAKINGDFLGDRITPWLISDFALRYRNEVAIRSRPLRPLANLATLILAFLSGPAILAWFWWRSFPAHSELTTVIAIGLPLSLASYIGLRSWGYMHRCATGADVSRLMGLPRSINGFWIILVVTSVFGWFKTEGTLDFYARTYWNIDVSYIQAEDRPWWSGTPFPDFLASAQLAGVDFVGIPGDWRDYQSARTAFRISWCEARDIPSMACGQRSLRGQVEVEATAILSRQREIWCAAVLAVTSEGARSNFSNRCRAYFRLVEEEFSSAWVAERQVHRQQLQPRDLFAKDLRNANLYQARLDGADLRSARLVGAELGRAKLEGANLGQARLQNANLLFADLDAADMTEVLADGADLFQASLQDAVLKRAQLFASRVSGADFTSAQMENVWLLMADAVNAEFHKADMRSAQLAGTRFQGARFQDAILDGSRVEGVDFSNARMVGASLYNVRLDGETDFYKTNFSYAAVNEMDFSTHDITQEQIDSTFADGSFTKSLLPSGVARPAHWPKEDLNLDEFHRRWRIWQLSHGYESAKQ